MTASRIDKLAAREERIAKNSPREYDLSDPKELKRLYREAVGYLRTCHHKHGTDWEGRDFAIKALAALERSHDHG